MKSPDSSNGNLKNEALRFHKFPIPGKVTITPSKKLITSYDLSLAYSPGVAYPCEEIYKDKQAAYDYTSKGNMVAVITNGTAVLGLGNLGAAASKPVMEGKSVLFKRFANIDSVDIEVETEDVEKLIETIALIGDTWGGINLEDIKSPECFEVERRLREKLNVPVFHDDQHGTAIITLAGLMNAAEVTGRKFEEMKVVISGSGAAGMACLELIRNAGIKAENITLCDSSGPIYIGRTEAMTQLKAQYAIETKARTLSEALNGADVFLGLSVKGALKPEMLAKMNKRPIIFAMANPEPEIMPEDAAAARPDSIIATGRSDYPNQVNNVMGFPYIFRGALDVRSSAINEEMKIAAAHAIASLAKKPIPHEVMRAYPGRNISYGPEYIIPTPFDPRLISEVSAAVAQAAMDSGVARVQIKDIEAYKAHLSSQSGAAANAMNMVFNRLEKTPQEKKKRIIFAEGEEPEIIRVAAIMAKNGYANPILIGREDKTKKVAESLSIDLANLPIKFENASMSEERNIKYADLLFKRLQRSGYLHRDCSRMIKTDRNFFSSAMLLSNEADSMVSGYTRGFNKTINDILAVVGNAKESVPFGFCLVVSKNRSLIIGDTLIHETPTPQQLAAIAKGLAEQAPHFGLEPRIAFVSHSNFGSRPGKESQTISEAVNILSQDPTTNFEYDGEMTVNVALSDDPRAHYPFNRLSGPATVLITNGFSTASFAIDLIKRIDSEAYIIGPALSGLERSVQIVRIDSQFESILNIASLSLVI